MVHFCCEDLLGELAVGSNPHLTPAPLLRPWLRRFYHGFYTNYTSSKIHVIRSDFVEVIADSSGFRWPRLLLLSKKCSPFTRLTSLLHKHPPSLLLTRQVPQHDNESTSPWPSGRRALCLARPPICRTASWSLWFAWWVSAGAQATCATGCL